VIVYKAGKTLPITKKEQNNNKITNKKSKTKQLHQQQIKNAVDIKHQMLVILML